MPIIDPFIPLTLATMSLYAFFYARLYRKFKKHKTTVVQELQDKNDSLAVRVGSLTNQIGKLESQCNKYKLLSENADRDLKRNDEFFLENHRKLIEQSNYIVELQRQLFDYKDLVVKLTNEKGATEK